MAKLLSKQSVNVKEQLPSGFSDCVWHTYQPGDDVPEKHHKKVLLVGGELEAVQALPVKVVIPAPVKAPVKKEPAPKKKK